MRNSISLGLVVALTTTVLSVRAGSPQRVTPPTEQNQMQFFATPASTTKGSVERKPLANQDNKVVGASAIAPAAPTTMAKRMLDAQKERGHFYAAKMKIWQSTPQAKDQQPKIEMISRPGIMTLENEKATIQIGQNVLSKLSTPKQKGSTEVLTVGRVIEVTFTSINAEKVSVRTKLATTEVTVNEPTNVETISKTKEAVTEAKLKEPVKFQLGSAKAGEPQTWCEMVVEEIVE